MTKVEEMIAIMEAYKNGKKIEVSAKGEDKWNEIEKPEWNWSEFDYRISPKSKYRPFKNVAEAYCKLEDKIIWLKCGDKVFFIAAYNFAQNCIHTSIAIDGASYFNMEYAFQHFVLAADDRPFGAFEQEK